MFWPYSSTDRSRPSPSFVSHYEALSLTAPQRQFLKKKTIPNVCTPYHHRSRSHCLWDLVPQWDVHAAPSWEHLNLHQCCNTG